MKINVNLCGVIGKPITFQDLKGGDVFQYRNAKSQEWDNDVFVLVNKDMLESGQIFCLSSGYKSWLNHTCYNYVFRVFDRMELCDPREHP